MPLLRNRTEQESDAQVRSARQKVDAAVDKMTKLLAKVEEQTNQARERLDERRTG